MKSLKTKLTSVKGITLISLVITIIILIILASIIISMILGNKGIINKAQTASDETKKSQATETMNLKITNIQISSYAENQKLPNLQYLADKLCEDNDMEYVLTTSKAHASLDKIDVTNLSSIYTKLKDYPYEFEINSSLQLASIDGVKIATVPSNDDDTIVSMTKAELDNYIENAINSKLNSYFCTSSATTTSTASNSKPCVVVENYKDGTEWYRVWSDGWIEQGGYKASNGTINFLKSFSDTNYTITGGLIPGSYNQTWEHMNFNSFTTNSVNFVTFDSYGIKWYACGY